MRSCVVLFAVGGDQDHRRRGGSPASGRDAGPARSRSQRQGRCPPGRHPDATRPRAGGPPRSSRRRRGCSVPAAPAGCARPRRSLGCRRRSRNSGTWPYLPLRTDIPHPGCLQSTCWLPQRLAAATRQDRHSPSLTRFRRRPTGISPDTASRRRQRPAVGTARTTASGRWPGLLERIGASEGCPAASAASAGSTRPSALRARSSRRSCQVSSPLYGTGLGWDTSSACAACTADVLIAASSARTRRSVVAMCLVRTIPSCARSILLRSAAICSIGGLAGRIASSSRRLRIRRAARTPRLTQQPIPKASVGASARITASPTPTVTEPEVSRPAASRPAAIMQEASSRTPTTRRRATSGRMRRSPRPRPLCVGPGSCSALPSASSRCPEATIAFRVGSGLHHQPPIALPASRNAPRPADCRSGDGHGS